MTRPTAPSPSIGVAGYGRLVDGGDLGDSYNYSPPRQRQPVDTPESVTVVIGDRGPVRARVVITATYAGPTTSTAPPKPASATTASTSTPTVELRADEAVVRVTTTFVNPSGDHRLRVHLRSPSRPPRPHAECAFAIVTPRP